MMRKYNPRKPLDKQSKNYYKTKTKYNNELRKIANGKKDFYHWITTKRCKENSVIVMENLDGKSMRNKKTSLNKRMRINLSQISFYEPVRLFSYKANFLIRVAQNFPSTQRCFYCGNVKTKDEKLTLNDRTYTCEVCGYTQDRDYNAALNIRQEGIRLAVEATRPGVSK